MKNVTAVVGTGLTALTLGLAAVGCSSATTTDGEDHGGGDKRRRRRRRSTTLRRRPRRQRPRRRARARRSTTTSKRTTSRRHRWAAAIQDRRSICRCPRGGKPSEATPDASYGGIVFSQPVSASDPPRINANLFKLTGNVDPAKVLALAPAGLKSIPGFRVTRRCHADELGGFKAAQAGGSYTKDGNSRLVAQKTVVIPADGAVFVLQLTADGLESDMGPLMDATSAIDKETKITP